MKLMTFEVAIALPESNFPKIIDHKCVNTSSLPPSLPTSTPDVQLLPCFFFLERERVLENLQQACFRSR